MSYSPHSEVPPRGQDIEAPMRSRVRQGGEMTRRMGKMRRRGRGGEVRGREYGKKRGARWRC
jgi:hypothetical protein